MKKYKNMDEKVLRLMGYRNCFNDPPKLMRSLLVSHLENNRCPFCHQLLILNNEIIRVSVCFNNKHDHEIIVPVSSCEKCKIPIAQKADLEPVISNIFPYDIRVIFSYHFKNPYNAIVSSYTYFWETSTGRETLLCNSAWGKYSTNDQRFNSLSDNSFNWTPDLSYETIDEKLLVYSEKCSCPSCRNKVGKDTIVDRSATVLTACGKRIDVTVQFCMSCGKYFMNYESFKAYEKKYGELDLNILFDDGICEQNKNLGFSEDSILSRHGYSVKVGIPRSERQSVLCHILHEKIATKHEVIKLITQFIKINRHRFPDACRRWEEDIFFVNQYRIDEQDRVGLLEMKQGGKIRR